MKTLIATLLATAAGSSFAFAPTAALNHDPATYRNVTQKAAADYKAATAKCGSMSGNEKDVCMAQAKADRAQAEADAIARYNNTEQGRAKSRAKVADANYELAKAKCGAMSGGEKDTCMNNAKSVHTAALADAKAGKETSGNATTGASGSTGLVSGADNPAAAKAVDKCQAAGGDTRTGCVIENKGPGTSAASRAAGEGEQAANRTVANRADNATDKAREEGREAKGKTAIAASDAAITTKVKANLFKEPDLKSLGIHVETEKGVVMLSGFVESRAEADRAVKVAKGVEGVTSVKSSIKVK